MDRTYIISEVGPNHNGKVELAKEVVRDLSTTDVDAI
jgi:sialic acid synthase SpsE